MFSLTGGIAMRAEPEGRRSRFADERQPSSPLLNRAGAAWKEWRPYLWSSAAVVLATLVGVGLTSVVPLPNVSMVFLLAIVFSAARFGIWPAVFSSGLSFLAYNFFFIEPFHTFSVSLAHELLALFIFLIIAVLTATIAGRARDQAAMVIERAHLDEQITEARAAAETERVRNTLLASISHDFRTPLASILGAASSLIEYGTRLPEATRCDLLSQVKDEAEHLDGMVRNLLAMTRVEAHALEVNKDWVDVRELFDRAVVVAKRRGASQSFQVMLQTDIQFIPGDPILLDQVLANVVGNAVRYAGASARIVLAATSGANDLVLSVTDDGEGIPADILPHVFEKFVRVPSRGDAGQGTGLGLAIAKGIVEAHGGDISAQSPVENDRGTRVEIRLPLRSVHS
jgi:K+-sensing histidine kinase KdpD